MSSDLVQENYNSKTLVSMWREFIDWDKHRKGEDNFLLKRFREHGVKKVFDASIGDGCDSIYLFKQGFGVTSNDLNETFIATALENARAENVQLKITRLDWRKLDTELTQESFEAVILLGNSLTYLFDKYVYCGDKVHGKPIEISDERVKMEYTNERTTEKGYLVLYPFQRGEMKNLLTETKFTSIEQFSDYKSGENRDADFYQYVCIK